jgi:tetratricopeptide (TPR) repeat protein
LEKACRYLKLSGQKAVRSHALWEGYGFYKEAVEFLSRPPETEAKKKELIEVIQLMRSPMGLLGFPEGSFKFLQQGERLAKEMGDTRLLAWIYSSLGNYYAHIGDPLMAIQYTEESFEEALKAQDIELTAPLGVSLCGTYISLGQFKMIVEKMPEVVNLIEKERRESDFFTLPMIPYSFICAYCGIASGELGRFAEGKVFLDKALANALRAGDPATLGVTHLWYGCLSYIKGDFTSAKEHLEKSLIHCEKVKWLLGTASNLWFLGHVYSFLGDREIGREKAEKGLQIYNEIGADFHLSIAYYIMGDIALDLGDPEKAQTSMEQALRLSRKNHENGWEGFALVGLGRVLGKREPQQRTKAEECFSQGLAIFDNLEMKPWYAQGLLFLGEFYLDEGEKEKALENLKEAEALFQEMGMDYWLERTRKILQNVR